MLALGSQSYVSFNIVCSIPLAETPHLKQSKNYFLFTYVILDLETLVAKDDLDFLILQSHHAWFKTAFKPGQGRKG